MWRGLKAHIEQNPFDHIVPMMGGLTEAIRVFLRSQYSSSWKSGSPIGCCLTVTSSYGRVELYNAFLQSPCWCIPL